jgi:hypothetical protein
MMPGAAHLYPTIAFMMAPPMPAILVITTVVMPAASVPAIVRLNDDARGMSRHACGGNTAHRDHRSDQQALHDHSPCSRPNKRESRLHRSGEERWRFVGNRHANRNAENAKKTIVESHAPDNDGWRMMSPARRKPHRFPTRLATRR